MSFLGEYAGPLNRGEGQILSAPFAAAESGRQPNLAFCGYAKNHGLLQVGGCAGLGALGGY
jgi:hypothetical protein